MRIALILNKAARERPVMDRIRAWIERLHEDGKVLIVDFHDPGYALALLDFAPQVVLTFPFTAVPLSQPLLMLKHLLGCAIVCLRTEGAIDFGSDRQLEWLVGLDRYGPAFVDYELFWGPRTAALVGRELVAQGKLSSLDRAKCFGHPALEPLFEARDSQAAADLPPWLRARMQAAGPRGTLLFITGFHLADYTPEDLIMAGDIVRTDDPLLKEKLMEAVQGAERAKRFRQAWIDMVLEVAGAHPETLLVVKCHPIEKEIFDSGRPDPYRAFEARPNIAYLTENVPVGSLLPHAGLFLHYGSTCVAESYVHRIPSVCVGSRAIYPPEETPTVYSYSSLGWPSTYEAETGEVAALVDRHLAAPAAWSLDQDRAAAVLHEVFNIGPGHLLGDQPYRPSHDIARFLLELCRQPPQALPESDPHLLAALEVHRAGFFSHLAQAASREIQDQRVLPVLACLGHLERLAPAGTALAAQLGRLPAIRDAFLSGLGLPPSGGPEPGAPALKAAWSEARGYLGRPEPLAGVALGLVEAGAWDAANRIQRALAQVDPALALPLQRRLFLHLGRDQGFLSSLPPGLAQELAEVRTRMEACRPRKVMVETVLACNLSCPECAIGGGMISRKKGLITLEQFQVIARRIRPYSDYLYLHIWGEPTLNPEIVPMVSLASTFTETNISTNALLLDEAKAEALITSGVTDLIVSIDGVSQEVYAKYRVGGQAQKAFEALERLQRLNLKHGGKVNILPQFVVFQHNEHELDRFREICSGMGLEATFKAPYIHEPSAFAHASDPAYTRPHYATEALRREAMRGCSDPCEVLTLLVDGTAVACCYDSDSLTDFGNIFEQEVEQIWNGPKYRQFRWDVMSGNAPASCLRTCLSYCRGSAAVEPARDPAGTAPPAPAPPPRPLAAIAPRRPVQPRSASLDETLAAVQSSFGQGRYPEAFDLIEHLVIAHPAHAVPLLAAAYDLYEALPDKESRYRLYQSRHFDFTIEPGARVLDIGSGHLPFPFATHLADLSLGDDQVGRAGARFKVVDGKEHHECSVEDLPFPDQSFDFIYCSHVLEHTGDPARACRELMRVGRRGYIETPTRGKDLWLHTARISNHRWAVEWVHDTLVFSEYGPEDLEGFSSDLVMQMHCAPQTQREKALSALIYLKAPLVNTMVAWEGSFRFEVRRRA